MLQENIKTIRKDRGLTQEELAIRVNVVRQTVSKWEKGLSVPDADMLQQLAEVLEVPVSQLLGEEKEMEQNRNEIAEQLARINEQLAIKNRRAKRIWTVVGVAFAVLLIIQATVLILSMAAPGNVITYTDVTVSDDFRVMEDQDGNRLIIESAGDNTMEFTIKEAE